MTSTATGSGATGALPFDDPAAYVAEDRRRALAGGPGVDGRVHGSTLFADVSGFTAMTEMLVREVGEQRGAEVLAETLERVFGEVIAELHRWGGSVLYFSGDAITCWFRDDDGVLATRCAFGVQETMARVGALTTPGGVALRLSVKVAVAAGTAYRFLAGDPAIQLIDVLAGSLMDEVAAAESAARPGDVVVTATVLGRLPETAFVEERPSSRGPMAVVRPWPDGAEPDASAMGDLAPPLPDAVTREWLLPPVYLRMKAGRGEFLSELRPGVPVFLRFGGLDFDTDPTAPRRLDEFVVAVQRVVDGHGGNVLQLTVGDKGAYLYAVFGAPIAHEDDAARACAAALDITGLDADVAEVTVGIASGRMRSGTYGHRDRRTYCCLGDPVNLAARLMAKADPGTVLVSGAVASAAGDRFRYGDHQHVALKGRAREADAVVVEAEVRTDGGMAHGGLPVIGRRTEIDRVTASVRNAVAPAPAGPVARITGVTGEVGAGKSRLLAETVAALRTNGLRVVAATAPTRGVAPAYAGWWPVWSALLEVDPTDEAAEVVEHLEHRLPPELRSRLPLLGALVGVPLPDNDLTASLDAKLRKESLEQLALSVLARAAGEGPLVLAIDDAHALDPLSRDLLVEVARVLEAVPVVLLLAYRSGEERLLGLGLEKLVAADELTVTSLDPDETRSLAARSLGELFDGDPPPGSVDLVVERSQGNPLWVRELCRYLHDRAVAEEPGEDTLPDTLHGLVLGRLDLLEETPRRTAKVASVIGRRFEGGLVRRTWPELGAEGDVRRALQHLGRRGLTTPDDVTADTWLFTHGVLRDVAYESLPSSLRSTLHDGVATALESGDFGDVERHLDALAHHSWHGEDTERKRRWLRRAGEAAQQRYANDTALLHYGRLLTVAPEDEQADLHLQIGHVQELQTAWEEAARSYERGRAAAVAAGAPGTAAWATVWSAEVARKQGHYADAQELLARAAAAFAEVGDDAGSAQVDHFAGTLNAQQGDLETAREHYTRSLEIRERLGDAVNVANMLSNLAVVAEHQQDYDQAGVLGERALAVRREIGDRRGIGISLNNLGMLATLRGNPREALERFEESMRLHAEVGDAWLVALGHHNLGNTHRDLGDHARARSSYAEALEAFRRFQDEWAVAALYEDLALLLAAAGSEDAWRLVGASDALHEHLGSRRSPDVTARLEQALTPEGEQLREQGASMSAAEVDGLVAASGG
ncbi:MAG: tetratricopeptide repeat protein [Nocardioidaceae bacterium]|nr:tetratricopeptide repeat protein [Nocardioidaceae bacterium]